MDFISSCCRRSALLSWSILLVIILNVVFLGGQRRTISVIAAALRQQYGNTTTRAELNWIGTAYTALNFLLMPLTINILIALDRPYQRGMALAAVISSLGCLCSAYVPSPTFLFLTFSLIHGIGSTLALSIASLIVGEYFDENHSCHVLATTLISGGAYGTVIFGTLFGFVVKNFGWRATFGMVALFIVVFNGLGICIFKPKEKNPEVYEILDGENDESGDSPLQNKITPSDSKESMDSWKKRPLWTIIPWNHVKDNLQIIAWICERTIFNIMSYSFFMNMVDLMMDQLKLRIDYASMVTLAIGIGESISITLGAILGDYVRDKLVLLHLICSFILIFVIMALYVYRSYLLVAMILVGFLGVFIGAGNTCLYALSAEICQIHGSVSYSATRMMASVGILSAPIFSGFIIQQYGYRTFFICQTVLAAGRFTFLLVIMFMLSRLARDDKEEKS